MQIEHRSIKLLSTGTQATIGTVQNFHTYGIHNWNDRRLHEAIIWCSFEWIDRETELHLICFALISERFI